MKKVLIIDDSPEFIFLVESLFKLKGIELESSLDIEEAMGLIKTNTYELLIIDYILPKSNGLKLIEEIRQLSQYETKPIILLTAKKLESDELQEVKKLGVLFLRKPIQPTEFYNKVGGIITG